MIVIESRSHDRSQTAHGDVYRIAKLAPKGCRMLNEASSASHGTIDNHSCERADADIINDIADRFHDTMNGIHIKQGIYCSI